MKPRVPGSKTMRVATVLTGVTTAAAGFLPAAAAHAATTPAGRLGKTTGEFKGGKLVRLKIDPGAHAAGPDNKAPGQPYWLDILFKSSVRSYQVCGWHPTGNWRCTSWNYKPSDNIASEVGGNKHSWDRGTIDIYWNGGAAGHRDTCNTNGTYNGFPISDYQSGYSAVLLTAANGTGIGDGVPEC
jgi:hypothetical protein